MVGGGGGGGGGSSSSGVGVRNDGIAIMYLKKECSD